MTFRPPSPSGLPLTCDVLVVGGGINGVGVARDLVGRGFKVVLCEKDDLAAHTSSASTKLIHGGLRYLEQFEFALVRKALMEREVLLGSAPHIAWPLQFVMPLDAHSNPLRSAWLLRAGLFVYDHLARRRSMPRSRSVNLREHRAGACLQLGYTQGFVYADGWVDDARLVVLAALDAAERGAEVLTRWQCVDAQLHAGAWRVQLRSASGGPLHTLTARALVNATGPWAAQFLAQSVHVAHAPALRRVKGSHIVVARLFEHDHAYILQNTDKRITFAIPYEGAFTLIGTTDVDCTQHPPDVAPHIDASEIAYLCAQVNRYFARQISPADVVWSYSGVRPLLDDEADNPAAVTRDYKLELVTAPAPLLTVWGGKLTTFRKLAEEAADVLMPVLGAVQPPAWTREAVLPGGDLKAWLAPDQRALSHNDAHLQFSQFVQAVLLRYPHLPANLCWRWARAYGTRIEQLLSEGVNGLGAEVAPGLFEAELRYLHRCEWARTAADVLWRRSKLGLHLNDAQQAAVQDWCAVNWTACSSDDGP